MVGETKSASSLTAQAKNIGYYAGVAFGAGYILTFAGIIAVVSETLLRIPSSIWAIILPTIPPWLIAGLICYLLAIICGIVLGWSIITSSRSIRNFGLSIDAISFSVTVFSFMILFAGIGSIILVSGASTYIPYGFYQVSLFSSLVYPIIEVVGAILLLIGFKSYRGKQNDAKLVGAIIMLVSVILVYIVTYVPLRGSFNSYVSILGATGLPLPGMLLSEATLEMVALIIAAVAALVFALASSATGIRNLIVGIVLSVSGILFSIGVLYFNFSAVSSISRILPYAGSSMVTLWIMFFGFLILGISGIIIILASCLAMAVSIKQHSIQTPKPATPPPPPPPST